MPDTEALGDDKIMEPSNSTRRVLVSVSSKSPLLAAAWEDPHAVVQAALRVLDERGFLPGNSNDAKDSRLLVIERWSRIYLVFDINHTTYDSETAHLPGHNDLPLIAIFFRGNDTIDIRDATGSGSKLREKVNEEVRQHHNLNGAGSHPPFVADHANGNVPTYWNPRDLAKSVNKITEPRK